MKVRILVENNTFIDQYYLGEPALSLYLEEGDTKILFDTGYSDVFIQNAHKMKVELGKITHLVLSHGHHDHTGGLQALVDQVPLQEVTLIAHPSCLNKKCFEHSDIGSPLSKETLSQKCHLHLTKEPYWITDRLVFLGEIPSLYPFEKRNKIGYVNQQGTWQDDLVMKDSALAYRGKQGIFIITGCSHSGICNIVETAKRVMKQDQVAGILGGFHLFQQDDRCKKTIEVLKQNHISQLYPCHCVSFKVKSEMHQKIGIHEVATGMFLDIE